MQIRRGNRLARGTTTIHPEPSQEVRLTNSKGSCRVRILNLRHIIGYKLLYLSVLLRLLRLKSHVCSHTSVTLSNESLGVAYRPLPDTSVHFATGGIRTSLERSELGRVDGFRSCGSFWNRPGGTSGPRDNRHGAKLMISTASARTRQMRAVRPRV